MPHNGTDRDRETQTGTKTHRHTWPTSILNWPFGRFVFKCPVCFEETQQKKNIIPTQTQTYTHVCVIILAHAHIYTHIFAIIPTYTQIYRHAHTPFPLRALRTRTQVCMPARAHAHRYGYTHARYARTQASTHVQTHTHTHTHTHAHTHTCTHIFAHIRVAHTHTSLHIHACVRVCVYIYVYISMSGEAHGCVLSPYTYICFCVVCASVCLSGVAAVFFFCWFCLRTRQEEYTFTGRKGIVDNGADAARKHHAERFRV